MNQCANCNATLDADAKFCKYCAAPATGTDSNNMANGSAFSKRKGLIIGGIIVAALLVGGGTTALLLLTNTSPTTGLSSTHTGPAKERAVQTLRDFLSAFNAGDYEKALSYFRNSDIE